MGAAHHDPRAYRRAPEDAVRELDRIARRPAQADDFATRSLLVALTAVAVVGWLVSLCLRSYRESATP